MRRRLAVAGLGVFVDGGTASSPTAAKGCPVLAWAASGAMSISGWPDALAWPEGDVLGTLDAAARRLEGLAGRLGRRLALDPARLVVARAAARAPAPPGGTVSFGRQCRLLPAGGSWVALNLARPEDVELLPALTAGRVDRTEVATDQQCWNSLAAEAARRHAGEIVDAARELGLPASVLGEEAAADAPWSVHRLGAPGGTGWGAGRPLVVDFTALWAGPLCAHLLGRAGARVVTVEAVDRPDAGRVGDPALHAELRRGHERLAVDFSALDDRRRLHELVASADVVLEASRPRALASLGLEPEGFVAARPGRTWVSITGYGRWGPRSARVAFGDDAAVAGGLVGRDGVGRPVFCADAVADPVSGLLAGLAGLASIVSGGGHLVDCSMAASSAFVNRGDGCPGDHRVERQASGWKVFHDETAVPVNGLWGEGAETRPDPALST